VVTSTAAVGGDEAAIRRALAEVADPEIPTVSIVDLGIVEKVEVGEDRIRVDLLPTFIGCPALDVIRSAVEDRLAQFGRPLDVRFTFGVPWTTERLTDAGRGGLRRAGIAPPAPEGEVTCPFCDSTQIAIDNLFGPTLCRSLYYCRNCRQPFEAFKPI
jgi:ring-1,2-phenylacetyl-CoA epoxidase subunit PaaD